MQEIQVSILTTERRLRKGNRSTRSTVTTREFSDFVIDGRSLLDLIGDDLMSCFVRGFAKENAAARGRLLTSSGDKRIELYVCPECGDIGCGSILTRIHRQDGFVIWDRLAWDNEIYDPVYDGARQNFALRELGPFRFEAFGYETAIVAASRI